MDLLRPPSLQSLIKPHSHTHHDELALSNGIFCSSAALSYCSSVPEFRNDLNGPSCDKANFDESLSRNDITARIIYMSIKWAKTMPSFSALCNTDQLHLLTSVWPELFLVSAFQWSLDTGGCSLFLEDSQKKLSLNASETLSSSTNDFDQFVILQKLYAHFNTNNLDQGELACLKAIVLFRAGKST